MIFKNITNFLKKRAIELVGLLLIFSSLLLFITFFTYSPEDPSLVYGSKIVNINNWLGIYGGRIADFLLQSFGLASFAVLFTIIIWGVSLIIKKEIKGILFKIFYLFLYLIFTCIFIFLTFNNSFWLIDNGNSGFVGQILYDLFEEFLPNIKNDYVIFVCFIFSLVFFTLASNINIKYFLLLLKNFLKFFSKSKNLIHLTETGSKPLEELVIIDETSNAPQQSFLFEKNKEHVEASYKQTHFKNYKLPSIDLLEKNLSKIDLLSRTKNRPNSEFIEKILLDFGIDGKITKINNGPVVSLYEFEPAPGIKVSKIINLSDDLARNTSSTSARVSIIPGKNTVGIEIPNDLRESVYLREIVSNEKFQKKEIKLPISLGKSISGVPIVGDLTTMPHLLIAGTTGSGKSVCINTIIVSLLYKLNPDLCKFILIDPKMLELSAYEGIPHLLSPVITDSKKQHQLLVGL